MDGRQDSKNSRPVRYVLGRAITALGLHFRRVRLHLSLQKPSGQSDVTPQPLPFERRTDGPLTSASPLLAEV